jgi:hypothetical protein
MHFALCKEQQQSQKQEFFRDYGVDKTPPDFQPAGLAVCIFLSSCSFCLLIWNFRVSFLYSRGHSAVSKLSPDGLP